MKLSLQFFSPRNGIYRVGVEIGGAPRGPRDRGARPHPRGQGVGPLVFIFCQYFLYFPKVISVDFQVIPRTFVFCTINNTMAVLLKRASVRVSFIQIMQVRVQNKGKSVWKSRYDGDISVTNSEVESEKNHRHLKEALHTPSLTEPEFNALSTVGAYI